MDDTIQIVAPTSISSPNIRPVRDINWADPNIYRSGIIPIYNDGTRNWFALGVTDYSSSLTAIGGVYDNVDHDLLTTAVREYNEEVGKNMQHLSEEAVYDCYAVQTHYTIQILLPVQTKIMKFMRTNELYDLIWVTAKQLKAMSDHLDFKLPGSQIKPFVFSAGLIDLIPILLEITGPVGRVTSTDRFVRPKRISKENIPHVVTDFSIFENDSLIYGDFSGNIAVVVTDGYIGIIRRDRTIYLLPIRDVARALAIINKLAIRTYVSTIADEKSLENSLPPKIIYSIERRSLREGKKSHGILKQFISELNIIRGNQDILEDERIFDELNLIMDYEIKLYESTLESRKFFNFKRACFLKGVNLVNDSLSRGPAEFWQLRQTVSKEYKCKDPTLTNVIYGMITSNLVNQNRETSIIDFF